MLKRRQCASWAPDVCILVNEWHTGSTSGGGGAPSPYSLQVTSTRPGAHKDSFIFLQVPWSLWQVVFFE